MRKFSDIRPEASSDGVEQAVGIRCFFLICNSHVSGDPFVWPIEQEVHDCLYMSFVPISLKLTSSCPASAIMALGKRAVLVFNGFKLRE